MQQARFCPFMKQSTSLHHLLWSQILVAIVQPRRWTLNPLQTQLHKVCPVSNDFLESGSPITNIHYTARRTPEQVLSSLQLHSLPLSIKSSSQVASVSQTLQSACISKHESYSLSRECFAAQGASISLISNFTSDYILLQAQRPLHYSWYRLAILSVFSGVLWCAFPNFDFAFS